MSLLTTHTEIDELGSRRVRHTQHMRPIAYRSDGALRPILTDWAQGDATFPHVITDAAMLVYTKGDGLRRICPTRDPQRYVEIGAPYIKPASQWQQVLLGSPTRTGNTIRWATANATVTVVFAGHYVDMQCELLNGWTPPNNQVAFPVGMNGLTRNGLTFYQDSTPVLSLRPMQVIDLADPGAAPRPVATELVRVGQQWYALATLPSLAGLTRPCLDPTLTLQPDATDGKDTQIIKVVPTGNYGTGTVMFVGDRQSLTDYTYRTLIKFDLTTLPAAATISAATLSLYCVDDFSTTARTFRVYRQKRAWTESDATWNNYDSTHTWSTAGGFHADDCEQTDIGSRAFTATETLDQFKAFTLTPTTKAGLDLGNGWMVKADTESSDAYQFRTSDWTTASQRPKLVIDYTLPIPSSHQMHGGLSRSLDGGMYT